MHSSRMRTARFSRCWKVSVWGILVLPPSEQRTPRRNMEPGQRTPRKEHGNMRPGSQTESQTPPLPVDKLSPCPKLRLRAVKRRAAKDQCVSMEAILQQKESMYVVKKRTLLESTFASTQLVSGKNSTMQPEWLMIEMWWYANFSVCFQCSYSIFLFKMNLFSWCLMSIFLVVFCMINYPLFLRYCYLITDVFTWYSSFFQVATSRFILFGDCVSKSSAFTTTLLPYCPL